MSASAIIQIDLARIALLGLSSGLARAVAQRYRDFLVGGEFALAIEVEETSTLSHAPATEPVVTRVGERGFDVRYGGLVAEIDLAAGRARARIPTSVYLIDSLLRIATSLVLLERGSLLLHASAVATDAGALVCFGPSGSGKTTVARQAAAGDVLCDEVIALSSVEGAVFAAGTPFHGDLATCSSRKEALLALVRLRHADHDCLRPLSPATAARELLASTLFFCRDETLVPRLLDVVNELATARAFGLQFTLACNVSRFVRGHLEHPALPAAP